MSHLFFRQAALAAVLTLMLPSQAWANAINTQALELAGQKNYTEALKLLEGQSPALQAGYEHRFLKARILSWAGDYDAAQAELDALIARHPGNPDVQLALGNLAFYQSELTNAERYYQAVLDQYPNYQDARTGLENVRKAQSAETILKKKWRIDGSFSVTDLTQDDLNLSLIHI